VAQQVTLVETSPLPLPRLPGESAGSDLPESAGRDCTNQTGTKAAVQTWPWQAGQVCGPVGTQPEDQGRFAVWRWREEQTRRRRDVGCRSQCRSRPSVQSRSSELLLLPPTGDQPALWVSLRISTISRDPVLRLSGDPPTRDGPVNKRQSVSPLR